MLYHPKEKYQLIKQKRKLTKFRLEEDKSKSKEDLGKFNMRAYNMFVRSQNWNNSNSLLTPSPIELVTVIRQLMGRFQSFDKIKEISTVLYKKYSQKKAEINSSTTNLIILDSKTQISDPTISQNKKKSELSEEIRKKIAHIFIVKGFGFSNFRQYFAQADKKIKITYREYRKEEIYMCETILRMIQNLITQSTEQVMVLSRTQLRQSVDIVLNKRNDMPLKLLRVFHQYVRILYGLPNVNEPSLEGTIELYTFVKEKLQKSDSGQLLI